MDTRYLVRGGIPLRGDVSISGSKNAALPIMAALKEVKEDIEALSKTKK